MRIKVLLFGVLAEKAGRRETALDLPDGATAADALAALGQTHPAIAAMRDKLAVAVDMAYVRTDHVLAAGDELALIPPVSGG